ncbi:hypothetical protein DFH06DRAFT_1148319 [Mycena polygramma]|nr:hypothetical protein DFH06DRAFT_1148319 [Mycena polygramma]
MFKAVKPKSIVDKLPTELLLLIIGILVGEQDTDSATDIHNAANNLMIVLRISSIFRQLCISHPRAWVNICLDNGQDGRARLVHSKAEVYQRLERSMNHPLRIVFNFPVIDVRSSTGFRDEAWQMVLAQRNRLGVIHLSGPRHCAGKLLCLRGMISTLQISERMPVLRAISVQFHATDISTECDDDRHEPLIIKGRLIQRIAAAVPITIISEPSDPPRFQQLIFLDLRNQLAAAWRSLLVDAPNLEGLEWFSNAPSYKTGLRILMPRLARLHLRDHPPPIHAPNLKNLTIFIKTFTVTDLIGITEVREGNVESIRSLRFIDCPSIPDREMSLIIETCSRLSFVMINNHNDDRLKTLRYLASRVTAGYVSNSEDRLERVTVSDIPLKDGPAKSTFNFLVRMGQLNDRTITFHRTVFRVRLHGCQGNFNDRDRRMVEELRTANGFGRTLALVSIDAPYHSFERAFEKFSVTFVFTNYAIAKRCVSRGITLCGELFRDVELLDEEPPKGQ